METIQKLQFKPIGSTSSGEANTSFNGLPFKSIFPSSNEIKKAVAEVEKPKEPSISQRDLMEGRQRGYEEGYAKGYACAKSDEAETEKKIQVSLDDLAIKFAAVSEAIKTRNEMNIQNMVVLALKIARKVAGTAIKNDPYIEIENIFMSNINLLFEEPTITIAVNQQLLEKIRESITNLAKIEGFKNNIEISGSPSIPIGSCDLKWNGGGIRSNKDEIWQQIEDLVNNLGNE